MDDTGVGDTGVDDTGVGDTGVDDTGVGDTGVGMDRSIDQLICRCLFIY